MSAESPRVAYFCMEFGLHDDLPIYSGGLGVLAGDVLKAAHDESLPVVGIGIFWAEGYVHQRIGKDGWPHDSFKPVSRARLKPLGADVNVEIRGRKVPLVAWQVSGTGHVPLYLLEPAREDDRWITKRLYQGGYGDRVAQEIVLGVGGVRLLRALGHDVDVLHLNEGHAVFAGLELVRESLATGRTLPEALEGVRRRLVFTTHTPVLAGNEAHDVALLLEQGLGMGVFDSDFLEGLAGNPFSMTEAGLRLASRANAVARLHAGTARGMWAHVPDAAPIHAITNGVHQGSWQDPRMRDALAGGDPWAAHQEMKRELLAEIEARAGVRMDENRLLVGFARRAVPYKRADLVLRDLGRVRPWLEQGRLQLVYSGKSHPDGFDGKGIIAHLAALSRQFPGKVAFLEGYDMPLGRLLTRGCDAWLNSPVRPMEASGTSGMKAAMNGVPSISTLDGWWAEACEHGQNGWQFGDGYEGPGQDDHDMRALLDLLERDVMPCYERDRPRWVSIMREAAAMGVGRFSAGRMVREYDELLWRR